MQFAIREKFWSWGDDYFIKDMNGTSVYRVRGKVFSLGAKLSFQDTNENELAFISQRMFSWKPCYDIHRDGQHFARIVKEFSWFNQSFTLDVPGPNDYSINGKFWRHEYEFQRGGVRVAVVSKKRWSLTDTYGIDIVDSEDAVSILCACIVIDQVLHDGDND